MPTSSRSTDTTLQPAARCPLIQLRSVRLPAAKTVRKADGRRVPREWECRAGGAGTASAGNSEPAPGQSAGEHSSRWLLARCATRWDVRADGRQPGVVVLESNIAPSGNMSTVLPLRDVVASLPRKQLQVSDPNHGVYHELLLMSNIAGGRFPVRWSAGSRLKSPPTREWSDASD